MGEIDMKTAFSTLCCTELSVSEIVELAEKANIDAIELRVDHVLLEELLSNSGETDNLCAKGVAVCDIASSIFIRGEGETPDWESYVKLAYVIGSPAVRVFASCGSDGELSLDTIADDLRLLCDIAGKYGIEIWLENHSELSRLSACRELYDKVNRDNIKILWDVLHSIEYGEALETSLSYAGDLVAHVHLKDGVHVEGQTEYLKKIKYNGYLSLEWESRWHPYLGEIYADNLELLEKYKEILKNTGFFE